uniref:Uncharacterized protein n=1 Tax=Arundo donax TaxID=35708 RepID=A0A0A9HA67_ARUDO
MAPAARRRGQPFSTKPRRPGGH